MSEHRPDHSQGLLARPGAPRRPSGGTGVTPYASYRDAVKGLIQADEPFGEVEEAIDRTDLTEDVRAALWLLAFSMREPRGRLRPARGDVHSIS